MELGNPHGHHEHALTARWTRRARLGRRDRQLSYARLLTVAIIVVLTWAAFWQQSLTAWWLLTPVGGFVFLMRIHDRVIRLHRSASRAVQWHERGLARLEDRWTGSGETGERFLDDEHPYSRDLDLFGEGSLFQLLNTAQTTTGEETLAHWLLAGTDPATARLRQAAVADLSTRTNLLEELYTLGTDARQVVDSRSLVQWGSARRTLGEPWLAVAAPALSIGFVVSLTTWLMGLLPGAVPLTLLLVNATSGLVLHRKISRVLHGSSQPARELVVLAAVLERLRLEKYDADRTRHLATRLDADHSDPVAAVRRLDWLIQMHDWQHNMFFAPIAASLLWGVQCAIAVESWRQRYGRSVEEWLAVLGEFEALAALATFRFEHPTYPFPTLLEHRGESDSPVYEAEQLAHPLLPRDRAVPNDVRLGAAPQLMVISGSNMSGKTTLLRTVGVNAVLAWAGAPVRASALQLSPVAVGGTLRVQDSLLAGRSRFYAEILRVKQLVEMARSPVPLLLLMDELFHGTNSHDRVEGAHGVLEFLVDLGAIGMVTTHDLALAEIGDRLGRRADNVHFEDHVVDGQLAFDYTLRPGRATHGNALALMSAVGIDVESTGRTVRMEAGDGRPSHV